MKRLRLLPIGAALLALLFVLLLRQGDEFSLESPHTLPLPSRERVDGTPSRIPIGVVNEAFRVWLDAFLAKPDRGQIPSGLTLARERREVMKRLIENDPAEALRQAVSREERKGLPREIVDLLEVPVSAAGEFELIVSCYTDGLRKPKSKPDMERFVTTDTARYRAFTYGRRAEMLTKDRISLHGIAVDDALAMHPDPARRLDAAEARALGFQEDGVVAEVFGRTRRFAGEDALEHYVASLVAYEDSPGPGEPGAPAGGEDDSPVANSAFTEGAKRILYLRVRFADDNPTYEPVSLATATSNQDNVAAHMKAASYGKMTITTTFPDVITLSQNKSAYVGQGLGTMMNEARDLAIALGDAQGADWNYNNYDFYTIISAGGIGGYAGVAQVGGRKSHLQAGYTSLRTAGHEFGHNFGLSHAYYNYTSDLNPRGVTPTDGLARVEYGHRFSVMSAQSGSDFDHPLIPHFTVHEKWRLDWLTNADFTDITNGNQTGTYRLYQNDEESATGIRALRVPSGGELSKYWLSYRTAWRTPNRGSNNEYLLNGVVFDWTGSGGGTSTLLDMTPYSDDGPKGGADWTRDNDDKWDAPLLIGRTYTDPDSQVSVTPMGRGGEAPNSYLDVFVHVGTGSEMTLVGETAGCRAVIPTATTATGLAWTAVGFNDAPWPYSGSLGIGYDDTPDYLPYFSVDVKSAMKNMGESAYVRVPFTIASGVNLATIDSLRLSMRYDDGFIAYLNGVKIAEANAPASPAWNSGASASHSDAASVIFEQFPADAALGALVHGTNVLAIHGLNSGTGSSDFLIQPKLTAVLAAAPNASPTVALTASTLIAGVNQDVSFTASASDPDNDTLAYAWDFDIGDAFAPEGLNNPIAVRRWSSAGLYAVTVACSDRKGGLARARVLVKVGNPASSGIVRGRVLRGGQPVEGARVFVEGTDTQSLTLADGSYLIAGLSSASPVTLRAMFDGEVFAPAVPMPVTANPLVQGVDFLGQSVNLPAGPAMALTVTPNMAKTEIGAALPLRAQLWDNTALDDMLVPSGDTWRYLDTGVAPAANWMTSAFDDATWLAGAAELGYGDGEATVVGYGADGNNRFVTTWFRRQFSVTNAAGISRLKLTVKRDDGIRVFLNGTEIARDNLTSGTVSASTTATNDVSGSSENVLLSYPVDPALLVEGPNVIAAEVHQSAPDSGDLSFDLSLAAARNLIDVTPVWSVSPPVGASVSVNGQFTATATGVYTVTATSGGLTDAATIEVASDNVVSIVALDRFLRENEAVPSTVRISRTGNTGSPLTVPLSLGGEATNGVDFQNLPSSVTLPGGASSFDLSVTVIDDSDAEGREWVYITLQPSTVYALGPGAVASVAIIDDENLRFPEAVAGADAIVYAGAPLSLEGLARGRDDYLANGDYWKFNDTGTDLGTPWRSLGFVDSAWNEGLGKFGYGDGNETTTISFGPNSSNRQITTYFRRHFHLADPGAVSALTARMLLDDGAVVYLNGNEAIRSNLPTGTIAYATRAVNAIGGVDEDTYFEWTLNPAQLVAGENILAVEVHQQSSTSSDLGFDFTLQGRVTSSPVGTTLLWEKVSGPGNASFSNPADPAATVTFNQPGAYIVRLTATQGGNVSADELTVTVNPVPTFAEWIAAYSSLSGPDADPLANPDGDEQGNLLEFASVTDPTSAHDSALPVLVRDPAAPRELLFTYRRIKALDPAHASGSTGDGYTLYGIRYTVEACTNLGVWQPAAALLALQPEGTPLDNGDGSETVTVRLVPPLGSDTRWFARLSVAVVP
jgi:hypothetical protein